MAIKKIREKSNSPFAQAWLRLKKNKIALISLYFLIGMVVVAILGYSITPDYTPDADDQILELQGKPIGFEYEALNVTKNKKVKEETVLGSTLLQLMFYGVNKKVDTKPINGYRFKDQYIYVQTYSEGHGGYETKFDLADVLFAKSINELEVKFKNDSIYYTSINEEKLTIHIDEAKAMIKEDYIVRNTFWLGSDTLGRDILSRLILGIRVSLSVGFISGFISIFVGVTLGAASGYFRGWIDDLIMWLVSVVWSIPALLLVFAIVLALDRGFWQIFIAVGLTMWVDVARLIRGQVLSVREKEFIEASQALGFKNFRIIFIHILPNVMGPVIVIAAANFATAILIEAGLSYLGIGVQHPTPSWGMMIKDHYGYIITGKPFLAIVPGLAIVIMVYAINLLGNGLRDAFDVRSK